MLKVRDTIPEGKPACLHTVKIRGAKGVPVGAKRRQMGATRSRMGAMSCLSVLMPLYSLDEVQLFHVQV